VSSQQGFTAEILGRPRGTMTKSPTVLKDCRLLQTVSLIAFLKAQAAEKFLPGSQKNNCSSRKTNFEELE
jgi:hypothetical protein